MRKSWIWIVGVLFLMTVLFPLGSMAVEKTYTVGVVIPYEIGWFTAFHKGFEQIANRENVKLVWQYHNYKADDETKAVQNLITMGVDARSI